MLGFLEFLSFSPNVQSLKESGFYREPFQGIVVETFIFKITDSVVKYPVVSTFLQLFL